MKNILIIGLGSIGQRHFRNLKKINKNLKFFAIRRKKKSPHLNNNNKVIKKKFLSQKNQIKEINFNQITNFKFDLALITNPTSLHLQTAIKIAKKKINLFIEKPISNNTKMIYDLLKLIKKNKLICAVGFQTRYDDLLDKIKSIIDSKELGEIQKCYIEHKHYLPYHHVYEDYKISYASRKDLGGGVLLCFSHEFDYANFLFGNPKYSYCSIQNSNKLKINVESSSLIIAKYNKNINVIFDLDFWKKKPTRNCRIQFDDGFVDWNLLKNQLKIIKNGKIKTFKSKFRKRNDLFIEQLKQVLKCIKLKKKPKSNIFNGISNIENIEKIKQLSRFN
jgi:predicted dehydrogenase